MAKLTEKSRAKIKTGSFAIPGERKYPIQDEQHARSALGFVAMHGSESEKKRVRAAVAAKYPGMNHDSNKHPSGHGLVHKEGRY